MGIDPEIYAHKEWLGLLVPVGLVVSPLALVKAQAVVDRSRAVELQQNLEGLVCTESSGGRIEEGTAWIQDFPVFAEQILGWMPEDLVPCGQEELPEGPEVVLPDYGETLRPTYTVQEPDSDRPLMLIQSVDPGLPLDEIDPEAERRNGWKATLQAKFERLLRETQIPIGLLCNGVELRLVYAPRGESSGHLTFPVQAMTEVPGRLILGALDMLVGADRLFNVPSDRRLPKILSDSRDYQAEVSTKLASQVLDALWELLRGFQSADAAVNGALLQELAKQEPQHIYGGLITTLMRLVFLLYAEDEGLMPDDEVYQQNYAVSGLYERLREDVGNYPDTMDQRYGAWTWLLSLFRLVYDGGGNVPEYLPARRGQLFEPDEYPFLEGRSRGSHFHLGEPGSSPRIPDGVIYRVLDKLLMLDGERLSYRALDVEQIGSVYEAIMGFEVEVAQGLSIAVRPKDVVVNVEQILAEKPTERAKRLQEEAECKLSSKESSALKDAKTPLELVAALDRKVSSRTPNLLPVGSLFLQPGEERRRTGSHYTPRKLTQPIVETTLRPVLEGLGAHPTAEQLLDLKVCDLAMGSGAFLVEACRQLAEKVVEAWDYYGDNHPHPPTPSSIKGEGELKTEGESQEIERWDVPDAVRQKMVEIARQFRKTTTRSEAVLWQALRGRKLDGRKFRRQQPIGSFIVDFFCPSEKLIVEVDGGIHEFQQELDQARQELLESLGLRFVRISSQLVENNLPTALNSIQEAFLKTQKENPAPFSPSGRRAGDEGENDVEPLLAARRLVAQRCLYGVDRNPFAVNLAKLSLWLVTLAKDRPFTFVDHALKWGDSLVGVRQAEIGSFGKTYTEDMALYGLLKPSIERASKYRRGIQERDARTDEEAEEKVLQLKKVNEELQDARLIGDTITASFFEGTSGKEREEKRKEYASMVNKWREGVVVGREMEKISERLRDGSKPVMPFNWEIEFPEVFDRENPGFDAIVGNPPFAGKNTAINSNPDGYMDWLKEIHPESHGNSDLVAHFFRRAFNIIRQGGTLGLIATNTIAQGDTRASGLRFICNNGGMIYNATRRYKWPGLAAVVVSVIHIWKTSKRLGAKQT